MLKNKTLRGKKMIPFIIQEETINVGSIKDLDIANHKIIDFVFD